MSLGVFTVLAPAAHAQMVSGNIAGTVRDASGALVPNVSVVVTNAATGVSTSGKSDAKGAYEISNLLPGTYSVVFSAPGFATVKKSNVQIDLSKTSTEDASLAIASSSSTVEVESQAAVTLDTVSTNLTQTLSSTELSTLPTATIGLGVLNTSLLSPNVATSGGIGAGTGPSVGGQRPRNNNYTIEGIDNNDKGVTGPLIYIPNDAVGEFTLITNQFSPEFGHSSGGQFNTTVKSGTNHFHGVAYEYFDNRNLNAIDASTARTFAVGETPYNPRYDFNRYGGEIGGPIKRDKLFFFGNFERQTEGQTAKLGGCSPTATGISMLNGISTLNQTNLQIFEKYVPVSPGTTGIDASADQYCLDQGSGPQFTPVFSGQLGTGTEYSIPLGNYSYSTPNYSNSEFVTASMDYTISDKDSLRGRYLYNTQALLDTSAFLTAFWLPLPVKNHLIAISEYHTFTPRLINEARLGYSRFSQVYSAGNFSYPGLDSFPNITLYDIGVDIGPDDNAPQSTIQNLYQFTDNVSYTKGNHTFKIGFDGRKYISPQTFTQRVRGDYEWFTEYDTGLNPGGTDFEPAAMTDFLHDNAPTYFGQRSTGNFVYYGDQTALYGYANDTWRVTPTLTLNYGLRYEFTSVPVGEREQKLNQAASVPGLINFGEPQPQKKNFLPRLGINYAPNEKTSIRAGFGMAMDVLYDNQGLLSLPPQYSSTNTVGDGNTNYTGAVNPNPGDPNFLANGGLPPGNGGLATFDDTPTVGCPKGSSPSVAICKQRGATAAFVPNQVLPYAETWNLGVQHVFASDYTAEVRYLGTRGVHLPAQIQLNRRSVVTSTNYLPTYTSMPSQAQLDQLGTQNTLASLQSISSLVPAYAAAGLTSTITSYQPYAGSSYNALAAQLTKRMKNGLQLNFAYTWSKTMDDATADVFSTVLTPRRPQDSQNVNADYTRSALDRTHRLTLEAIYDVQAYKSSGNWALRNLVGNWLIAPIYTYQSPEYGTVNSGDDANLNGDAAPDRAIVNGGGNKSIGSGVTPLYSSDPALAAQCPADSGGFCAANTVAYIANNPSAYYITAGLGALATASRNTLPLRPINDVDATATKSFQIHESIGIEFMAQAFNLFNHPQFISGSINTINSVGDTSTSTLNFLKPSSAGFNRPEQAFSSNARSMQLAVKLHF
jgi:hypothetical protein